VLTRPGQVLTRPGQVLTRPGQVLTRPGQVLARPGQVISRPLIAQVVSGKQGMAQIVASKQQLGGVTQLVAKQPVTAQLMSPSKPGTQLLAGRQIAQLPVIQGQQVTQVVRTSQGITQILQGGKQIVRTAAPGQVHQVIQQSNRPQFVVVSTGDSGQRSRYVLIQQPSGSGQAKPATIKTIQGQTIITSPQPQIPASQTPKAKGATS